MAMYDNDIIVKTGFNLSYITEYLQQAQWAELIELKKVITEMYNQKRSPVRILDIGIGNARVPKHLNAIHELWEMIEVYDGIDNAQACITLATETAATLNIQHKLRAFLYDATKLSEMKSNYDLVVCTWFTPGNFYPPEFDFEQYRKDGKRLNLDVNPSFELVFKGAYDLLVEGGLLVLGAVYIDSDATRIKQEQAYQKMEMHVITDVHDSFTATKEGFWSQRFTKEKLLKYLHFAPSHKINFVHLDTYEYAMQVHVKK
ncbi:MAG: methyltransferase domain-containing protein [Chitinophagaceae bacterium]|nr:methyltransferase domain-containing protein [Chitinophagaceae bacterium]